MPLFTIREIIDIIIMTAALGYIFMGIFPRQPREFDIRRYYSRFDFEDFKFSIMVTAPAIILHEFGHKFTALYFGLDAIFNAFFPGLLLGIVLKLMNFGFIFFIPGFVSYSALASPLQQVVIAFAGPAVNLVLWLGAWYLLRNHSKAKPVKKYAPLLHLTRQINMLLFFFNMLPIPPFDGSKVFFNLFQIIF